MLDLWTQRWRRGSRGDVIVIRYVDDLIVGFQRRHEAERYLAEVAARFARFGLELHCQKTRLIEFGRFAAERRAKLGEHKPETFDFLGFTHACGRSRRGWFVVRRWTGRKAIQRKLREVHQRLRDRMHEPVPEQGRYIASVVRGHCNYFGLPGNSRLIRAFRQRVIHVWRKTLSRRSQRGRIPWHRINRLVALYVPPVRLKYTNPDGHLASFIQGRSPVR